MIYLRPRGGLCNRMRTVDSLLALCKDKHEDLTVFWVLDGAMNIEFEKLFEIQQFDEFKFKVINCPIGFPELYTDGIATRIKNVLKGRYLAPEFRFYLRELSKVSDNLRLPKKLLDDIYNPIISSLELSVNEADSVFITQIRPKLEPLFNQNTTLGYINSCYRLSTLIGNYQNFVPIKSIRERVTATTNKFGNTIGLHIRKSDHVVSKKISTTDKFVHLVEQEIAEDSSTTFFLSTDDSITKNNLIDRYGDKIIFNEVSNYERDSPQAAIDAVVDLYCLARTSKLYGSHHSSFSQVAAQIGSIEEITAK